MSNQEFQIRVGQLRNLAQGNDVTALRLLRVGAMELHSALPILSPYIELVEQVLVVTKEGGIPQRFSRARQVLSWLAGDLVEDASYLAEKPVNREEDGSIVYA